MDRYDPFEKLSDLYDSIVDWQSDPLIKPDNQNKYLFSDGKTYYEELCKILKLLSVFKDGFNQIYDNLDELEEQIQQSGVTQEELEQAINNLHTTITGEIALVENSLSSDISDLDNVVTSLSGRVTSAEGNISTLQTLTATHSSDIATINNAITSIQSSLQTKIGDAPSDGKTYGRKNGAWQEVQGGSGGTSDYDALDNKPQINGNTLSGNKTGAQMGLVDTSALNNYVAKTDAPGYNDILTKASAQLIYQTIQAMANYLQKTDAPGYDDILTQTDASTIYQTILAMNDYLLKNDAPGYADILTKTSASTLYQTISGMSAYLTSAVASSTYQTKTGMSEYLKKTDAVGYNDILTKTIAQTLYQAILQSGVNIKTINNQSILGGGNLSIPTGGFTISTALWTNPNPSVRFEPQTIQVNSSGYTALMVCCLDNMNSVDYPVPFIIGKNSVHYGFMLHQYGRGVYADDTSVTFVNANNTATDRVVPYKIYGIK